MISEVCPNSPDVLFVEVGNIKSRSHFSMVGEKKLSNRGILLKRLNVLQLLLLSLISAEYLDPLIQTLGAVANLTVDSQVQFTLA